MKYTSKAKLKYVLVKNDKESKPFKTIYDIYKASDTYSGVHYAKGGLTDAKYVSKRNSIVVDDNGKIVYDKLNGVWLKETAKPVGSIEGTEAMELKTAADWENYLKGGSGSQEVELTPNVIRKGMYGWKGKTYSKGKINGYDWDITTLKVSSGKLVSSIQGGSRSKGDGFESFQFTMSQDPSANLIVTSPKVVNEKRVREQHEQAVEEFKRLVREERLPEKKYGKGGKLFGAGNFAEGGSIGFIPMDMEEKLRLIGKWGDISIKQVIGLLNAMIDSGVTDEDLVPKPKKNTSFQREKATEAKIKEIWTRIEPNYKGDLIGNRYYSSLKELISRNWIYQDLLKNYKPLRKLHKDEVEIKTEEVRKMSGGDAVLYKDEQWYVTEKNGQLGIGNFRQGAWGMDFPFIPLSRIDMDSLTDMMGRKVQIVQGYAKGGYISADEYSEKLENKSDEELLAEIEYELGIEIDSEELENERETYIDELVNSYKRVMRSRGSKYAKGGGFDLDKHGTLHRGDEFIKYQIKDNGNYKVEFYRLEKSNKGMYPVICEKFRDCKFLDFKNVHHSDLKKYITENNFFAKGGTFGAGNFAEGGKLRSLPPKGELTNKDNLLLKYEKVGNVYNFYVYEPITKEVSGYEQTRHICKNPDCAMKMNYAQFINYLYAETYLDDKKYAKGGGVDDDDYSYAKTRGIDSVDFEKEMKGFYGADWDKLTDYEKEILIEDNKKAAKRSMSYAKGGTFGAGNFAEGGKLENISPVLRPKIEAIERILPKALGESTMTIEFAFQTNTGYAFNMISKTDLPVNRATPKLKKIGVEVERTGEKGRRLITIPRGVFDKMTAIYADGGLIEDLYNQRRLTDIQIRTQLVRILGVDRASDFMARDNNREHGVSAMSLLLSAVSKGWLSVDEIDFNMYYAAESAADEAADLEEIGSSDLNFILKEMLEDGGIEMGYEGNRIVRKYSNPEEVNIKDKTHRNGK